ncbi:MAG: hypothetical protein ABI779_14905 [Acidobacteriota bacterium]
MSRTRTTGVLAAAALAVTVCYGVRIDGSLRPVGTVLTVPIESHSLVTPAVYRAGADSQAVYVVADGPRPDGRFDATRVDTRTGQLSRTAIPLGPRSGFSPFLEAEVRIDVTGLSFRRPTFHLLSYPDGRGPGFHLVDSHTGLVRLNAGSGTTERTLLTCWVFNSSKVAELRSLASTDAMGNTIAVVSRSPAGWMLHLFDRSVAARSSHSPSLHLLEKS